MSDSKTTVGGNIGFFGLLGIVFITLKLCGVIDWSWWWVLAPLWGPLALVVAVLVGIGVVAIVFAVVDWVLK